MKIRWWYVPALACWCATLSAQTAATSRAAEADTVILRLADVIRLSEERSPERMGAQDAAEALRHRIRPATTLPDPMVSGGLAAMQMAGGGASSYRSFAISEQFPARGKLRLAGEVVRRDVEVAQAECEAARRQARLAARLAFDEYFYLDRAIAATRVNKELLERLEQIAEAQYRVNRAPQQDVLRAQREISLLVETLTTLEMQQEQTAAELNATLQRAPEIPLGRPEALQPQRFRYSLEEMYALAEANDTGIARSAAVIERGKAAVELAKRQSRPDVTLGYMFEQRVNEDVMNGVTVGVTLPIFRDARQREAVAEASSSLASARRMQEGQRTAVRAEMRRFYLAAEAAGRLMELYEKGIVPQAALELESSMSAYQVGKAGFSEVMTGFKAELEYETGYYRQLTDRANALARMESYTGEEVSVAAEAGATQERKGAR